MLSDEWRDVPVLVDVSVSFLGDVDLDLAAPDDVVLAFLPIARLLPLNWQPQRGVRQFARGDDPARINRDKPSGVNAT
jgi:hypothetical protein